MSNSALSAGIGDENQHSESKTNKGESEVSIFSLTQTTALRTTAMEKLTWAPQQKATVIGSNVFRRARGGGEPE